MPENLEYIKSKQRSKATLSLSDIVGGDQNVVTEYLSLSITRLNGHICVGITTTDTHPITYTAIISNQENTDLSAVQFVRQSKGLTL